MDHIEDRMNIIIDMEKKIFANLSENINMYFDYCTLTYHLYLYFKQNNINYANNYYNKGRYILKELLKKISLKNYFFSNMGTWNGIVGILYIMQSYNLNQDLDSKIKYLEEYVVDDVTKLLNERKYKLENIDLDIVSGISGVGLYFLNYCYKEKQELIKKINYRLIEVLSSYNTIEYQDKHIKNNPKEIDYSISHGVLGIIYYLSKYYSLTKDNSILEEINKSLEIYIIFMLDKCHNHITKFPSVLRIDITGQRYYHYSNRSVWCYGSIGTFRALYLISKITKNECLKNLVIKEVQKFEKDKISDFNLICPTFCHGLSGMYLILSLFNNEELKSQKLKSKIIEIENKIWIYYNKKLPYFFPKIDDNGKGNKKIEYDNTSFVSGAVSIGICYILLKLNDQNNYFTYSLALK